MIRIPDLLTSICFVTLLFGCQRTQDVMRASRWADPSITQQDSDTDQLLIGLHAVNEQVVWASGTGGTFVRTLDGGLSWEVGTVPGADTLQFRDVHAFGPNVAYLLSIGHGEASRIYKTTDGGQNWEEQFVNRKEPAFFDCFDFWSNESGIAFSDAVDGRFPLASLSDGSWQSVWGPDAQPNEGGFAASGTCLVARGTRTVLIGTGNAEEARVLRSDDRGATWSTTSTPIVGGEGAGITTLAFQDDQTGIAMGGDLARPNAFTDNVAVTEDGGRSWRLAEPPTFAGAVYGSAHIPGTTLIVATGPKGASYTRDNAESWAPLDPLTYWSVDFVSPRAGWMVGTEGRIAKVTFAQEGER